jgi:two-component system chemotaxis response regulator CheY
MQALVVDDSRSMRALMKKILQEAGFEVTEAVDGQEGLDCLRRLGPVALALVDWNMPLMDGLAFVQSVRADRAYANQRLIMVTTEAGEEYRQKALAMGADAYVVKPFTAQVLLANIRHVGLPVAGAPATTEAAGERPEDRPAAMVIDDSRVTRLLLGQILKKLGFAVTEASNGEEALAALRQGPVPRLALVDCNMPGMDGPAVVRAVRADPKLRPMGMLMVTGEDESAPVKESLAAGAGGYLRKPFTGEQVQQELLRLGILLP